MSSNNQYRSAKRNGDPIIPNIDPQRGLRGHAIEGGYRVHDDRAKKWR